MAGYNRKKVDVRGHYRTYYTGSYPGPYKKVRRYVKKHTRIVKQLEHIPQSPSVINHLRLRGLPSKTMVKKIPDNLIEGIKAIAKDQDHEYSVDIDFERHLDTPEQMLIMKGGPRSTIKGGDFEMFGHTHPTQTYPQPSPNDLKILVPLRPEFIMSQKTGKTIIMNIEDIPRWHKWIESGNNKVPYCGTEYGRDLFFNRTGVRIYPMAKNLTIELKDDPYPEKIFPRTKAYPWPISREAIWPSGTNPKKDAPGTYPQTPNPKLDARVQDKKREI